MKSEHLILALDQGTTSSRSILFRRSGEIVASAQREFQQIYPQPGWVEHDPMEIWASQSATMSEVLSRADVTGENIAAIGITNQRETTIVWDKHTGKPIHHAIVWQDRRTAGFCSQLKQEGLEPLFTEKTGLFLDPYFSGTKLHWLLEHVEGAREKAEQGDILFGTVDTWLIWQLSGRRVHVTDVTNASRTLLFNIDTLEWDDEILELLRIPRQMLPEVRASSETVGEVGPKQLLPGVPISGIAGDQHAALFGQTCFSQGMAKNTYGTGCFLLMNMGTERVRSENNLISTIAWKIGDTVEYALEGSVFIAGAAIQWLRDELQLVRDVKELDDLAASVPDAGGMVLVPAFTGLGAPHWDPYARGTAVGITRGTNRAHFCRAVLESIAFQTRDLLSAMEKDSGITLKELRVDGGASKSTPLLQFQSDLLQAEVIRPTCVETTALGAAYLAGLAVGFWSSLEEIRENWKQDVTFQPEKTNEEMAPFRFAWEKAVGRSQNWIEPE